MAEEFEIISDSNSVRVFQMTGDCKFSAVISLNHTNNSTIVALQVYNENSIVDNTVKYYPASTTTDDIVNRINDSMSTPSKGFQEMMRRVL